MPSETEREAFGKIVNHLFAAARHRTSISLESALWDELKGIANARGQPLAGLVAAIDAKRGGANLSSAIRPLY
jgi:predicted DNA-binding ribbon-helix-helix protein